MPVFISVLALFNERISINDDKPASFSKHILTVIKKCSFLHFWLCTPVLLVVHQSLLSSISLYNDTSTIICLSLQIIWSGRTFNLKIIRMLLLEKSELDLCVSWFLCAFWCFWHSLKLSDSETQSFISCITNHCHSYSQY